MDEHLHGHTTKMNIIQYCNFHAYIYEYSFNHTTLSSTEVFTASSTIVNVHKAKET
jgi:hypothetical protein